MQSLHHRINNNLIILKIFIWLARFLYPFFFHFQYFCYTLIGCLQLFGCAFFAWIFAEAVHLYLSTRLLIDKGDGRLPLFYFIGWGKCLKVLSFKTMFLRDSSVLFRNKTKSFYWLILGLTSFPTNSWYAPLQCLLTLYHGPSSWLVVSDSKLVNTSLATN